MSTAVARRNRRLIYAVALIGNLNVQGGLWIVYLRDEGLSLAAISALYALFSVAIGIGEIPLGLLADRFGRKPLVLIGYVLGAAYGVLMLGAATPGVAAIAFVAFGFGISSVSGAELALLVDSAQLEARTADDVGPPTAKTTGRYFALVTGGMSVGLLLGGGLASISWQAVFVSFAILQIAAAILSARLVEIGAPREATADPPSMRGHAAAVVTFFRLHAGARALVLGLAAYSAIASFAYYFFQELLAGSHMTRFEIGATYAAGTILAAGIAAGSYRVERRVGRGMALGLALATTAAAFSVLGTGAAAVLVAGFCALTAADSVVESLGKAAVTDAAPPAQRATTLSVLSLVSHLLTLLATPALGVVADARGLGEVLAITGVATITVAGLCLRLFFARAPRAEPPP